MFEKIGMNAVSKGGCYDGTDIEKKKAAGD